METNHHLVITYLEEEQKQRAEESASVVKGVSYLKEIMEVMKNSLKGELRFLIEQTQKETSNEMEKAQKAIDLQLEEMQCFPFWTNTNPLHLPQDLPLPLALPLRE